MGHQKRGLSFKYYIDGNEVSKDEYFEKNILSKMSKQKAAKCIQLVYYQIWYIYNGFDDSGGSTLLHHDQDSDRTYIHIMDYALKVFVSLIADNDVCYLYEAVPA